MEAIAIRLLEAIAIRLELLKRPTDLLVKRNFSQTVPAGPALLSKPRQWVYTLWTNLRPLRALTLLLIRVCFFCRAFFGIDILAISILLKETFWEF